MVEIIKVYRESLPSLRLIGKRYTDKDRGPEGSFSSKWGEWFQKSYFETLEGLASLPENEGAYLGCMRCADEFEYWIGMFFSQNTPVQEGYEYVDIPAGNIGTCWIYGREDNGEIYGEKSHNMCLSKIKESGWQLAEESWFFERYNCPRFTRPDENGKVILDYCMYFNRLITFIKYQGFKSKGSSNFLLEPLVVTVDKIDMIESLKSANSLRYTY